MDRRDFVTSAVAASILSMVGVRIATAKIPTIQIASVKHTGLHFLLRAILGSEYDLTAKHLVDAHKYSYTPGKIVQAHFGNDVSDIIAVSQQLPTVVPLRHPVMVAASWKKRGSLEGLESAWSQMDQVTDVFYFPMESKPFDELERYIDAPVYRHNESINLIGDYPEKASIETARKFLGKDAKIADRMLKTEVGKRFYA